eukprot:721798-Prymnesium_polylepis.1
MIVDASAPPPHPIFSATSSPGACGSPCVVTAELSTALSRSVLSTVLPLLQKAAADAVEAENPNAAEQEHQDLHHSKRRPNVRSWFTNRAHTREMSVNLGTSPQASPTHFWKQSVSSPFHQSSPSVRRCTSSPSAIDSCDDDDDRPATGHSFRRSGSRS